MAIVTGNTDVEWRFHGLKSCCWLTAIEMVMQWKHKCIYGVDRAGQLRTQPTDTAQEAFKKNKGSNILIHAHEYGLKANDELTGNTSIEDWKRALQRGPILAAGRYGLARMGWGMHVIVIVGVSATNKLAYYNPNMFAFFPHTKSKLTYFTVERCVELAEDPMYGGPFWQAT